MNLNYNQKLLFLSLFVLLGLLSLQVPLVHLAGSKAQFTVFDSFAPIASGFLDTTLGIIAILLMQVINFVIHGSKILDLGTMIRFLPILFTAMYFGQKTNFNWMVSVLAIIIFNLNPVGRSVWFYSLFWLVPIVCYFWQEKFLLARTLGATFTQHAVGGAIWIWTFHLPASVWIGLIPVVIAERAVFALAMSGIYLVMKSIIEEVREYAIHQS